MNPHCEVQWSRISEVISERMGLHFPQERRDDLERGLAGVARELGVDEAGCADWLLGSPSSEAQLQLLASHLTIGETYFFRDMPTLNALNDEVLPALIRARRGRDQRLNLWSAACCSGEEAYTLAILLHRLLPDLHDWQVTITATDINPMALNKARAGTYSEWSFRNAPDWLRERYFLRSSNDRFTLIDEIRTMVNFGHLNLVDDAYPSLATGTSSMDIILCRNVLMYFTPPHIRRVIASLHRSLVAGGWLAVSPSEASRAMFPQFLAVNFPGAIFFRKVDGLTREVESKPTEVAHNPLASAETPDRKDRSAATTATLPEDIDAETPEPAHYGSLARSFANQGKLAEALKWCDRWIVEDKVNSAAHYLRAVVLLEQHAAEEARASLKRVIYLDPDFVLAHFALGNLARGRNENADAGKHFANALHLARRYGTDELLPESDGLTAGRLVETLTLATRPGSTP